MFAEPGLTPVTAPVEDTAATLGRSDVHAGVIGDDAPAAVMTVAVAVVVEPVNTPGDSSDTLSDTGDGEIGVRGSSELQDGPTNNSTSHGQTPVRTLEW